MLFPLSSSDIDQAISLLAQEGLPTADLPGEVRLYALKTENELLGIGGLELRGHAGLLRSLTIPASHRGKSLGTELVRELNEEARSLGLSEVWLLTETAAPFFAKLGFDSRNREEAPQEIRSSAEFSALCPDSAICMSLKLID